MKTRVPGYLLDVVHLQRQGQLRAATCSSMPPASLRYRDTVRANGTLRNTTLPPLTIAVEASRDALPNGEERLEAAARVSTIVRGTALSNSFAWYRDSGVASAFGTLQLSRRMFDMGLSALVGRATWFWPTRSLDKYGLASPARPPARRRLPPERGHPADDAFAAHADVGRPQQEPGQLRPRTERQLFEQARCRDRLAALHRHGPRPARRRLVFRRAAARGHRRRVGTRLCRQEHERRARPGRGARGRRRLHRQRRRPPPGPDRRERHGGPRPAPARAIHRHRARSGDARGSAMEAAHLRSPRPAPARCRRGGRFPGGGDVGDRWHGVPGAQGSAARHRRCARRARRRAGPRCRDRREFERRLLPAATRSCLAATRCESRPSRSTSSASRARSCAR